MQTNIATFDQAEEFLATFVPKMTTMSGSYNLKTMKMIMTHLGNPQEKYHVIHIAGTSGKTSTAYFISALLRQSGKKIGLTVSPHVDSVAERVQINGHILSEKEYCSELTKFIEVVQDLPVHPTYFELLVAFTYWEFARQKVDYAVIEVGMGGLLDGTNVIDRSDKVCVITDIGFDHTEFLGDSLSQIAAQKAGIVRPGNHIFTYKQSQEVDSAIEQTVSKNGGMAHVIRQNPPEEYAELPLFQRHNFFLAKTAVSYVAHRDNLVLSSDFSQSDVVNVYIPARMEEIRQGNCILILDGSHNGQKMGTLVRSIRLKYPSVRFSVMLALTNGKDIKAVLDALKPIIGHLILTKFSGQQDLPKKAIDPMRIAKVAEELGITSCEIIEDPEQAFEVIQQSENLFTLVTGSFFLLNHVRPKLREQGLIT